MDLGIKSFFKKRKQNAQGALREDSRRYQIQDSLIESGYKADTLEQELNSHLGQIDRLVADLDKSLLDLYDEGDKVVSQIKSLDLSPEEQTTAGLDRLIKTWQDFKTATEQEAHDAHGGLDQLRQAIMDKERAERRERRLVPGTNLKFQVDAFAGQVQADDQVAIENIEEQTVSPQGAGSVVRNKVVTLKKADGTLISGIPFAILNQMIARGQAELGLDVNLARAAAVDSGALINLLKFGGRQEDQQEALLELLQDGKPDKLNQLIDNLLEGFHISVAVKAEVKKDVVLKVQAEMAARVQQLVQKKSFWNNLIKNGKWPAIGVLVVSGTALFGGVGLLGTAGIFAGVKFAKTFSQWRRRNSGETPQQQLENFEAQALEDLAQSGTIVDLTELGAMIANSVRTEGGRQIRELELKFSADPALEDEKTVAELLPEYLASATEYLEAQGVSGEQLKTMARAVALSQLRSEQQAALTQQDLERVRRKGPLTRFGNWAYSQYGRVYGASPELERYIETKGTAKDALVLAGAYALVGGTLGYGMRHLATEIPGLRSVMGAMGGLALGKLINEYGDSARRKQFLREFKKELDNIGTHLTNYEKDYRGQGLSPEDLDILDEARLNLLDYQSLSQIPELKITPGLRQQMENHLRRIEALKIKFWQTKREVVDSIFVSIDKMIPSQLSDKSRRELKANLLKYQNRDLSDIPQIIPKHVPGQLRGEWSLERYEDSDIFIVYQHDHSSGTAQELARYCYDQKNRWQLADETSINQKRISLEDQAGNILENLRSRRELVPGMEIKVTLINSQAQGLDLDPDGLNPEIVRPGQVLSIEYVGADQVEFSYDDPNDPRGHQILVSVRRQVFEAELEMGNLTQSLTPRRQELLKRMDAQASHDHVRRIAVLAGMATVGALAFSGAATRAKEFYARPAVPEAAAAVAAAEPAPTPEVIEPERTVIDNIEYHSDYNPQEQAYLARTVAMVDARLQENPTLELQNFKDQLLMEIRHGQAETLLEATASKDLDLNQPDKAAQDLASAAYFKASAADSVPLPETLAPTSEPEAPAPETTLASEAAIDYDYAVGSDGTAWRVHQDGENFVVEQRTAAGQYEAVSAESILKGKMQIIKGPDGQVRNILKLNHEGEIDRVGVLNKSGKIVYEKPTETPSAPEEEEDVVPRITPRLPGEHYYSDAYPDEVLEAREARRLHMLPLEPHESAPVPPVAEPTIGQVPLVDQTQEVEGETRIITRTYGSGAITQEIIEQGKTIALIEVDPPRPVELVPRQIPELGIIKVPDGTESYVISGPGPAQEANTQYFRTTDQGFEVFDPGQKQWVISEYSDLAAAEEGLEGRSAEIRQMIPVDTAEMYKEPEYNPERVRWLYDHQQLRQEMVKSKDWLLDSSDPQEFMDRLEARNDLFEYADDYKGFEYRHGGLHGVTQKEIDALLERFASYPGVEKVKLALAEQTDGALNVDDHQTRAERQETNKEDHKIRRNMRSDKKEEIARLKKEEGLKGGLLGEARREYREEVWRAQHGFPEQINVQELRLRLFREEVPINDFYKQVRGLSTDRLYELSRYSHDEFQALMRSGTFTPQEVERLLQERAAILAAYNEQTLNYHSGQVQALDQQGTVHAYRQFRPQANHLKHGFDGAGHGRPTEISFHEAKPLVDIIEQEGSKSQWRDVREALRQVGYYPRVLGQGAGTAVKRTFQDVF